VRLVNAPRFDIKNGVGNGTDSKVASPILRTPVYVTFSRPIDVPTDSASSDGYVAIPEVPVLVHIE
jgi:hypothetical protein